MTSLLGSNLQEIRKACKDTTSDTLDLVSNFSSTAVYHASAGWGRLWTWFYDAVEWLFCTDLKREERKEKVIQSTHLAFAETLPKIQEDAKTYQNHLLEKIQEKEEKSEREIGSIRRHISSWNCNTRTFIEFLQEEKNDKRTFLFENFFPDLVKEGKSPFVVSEEQKTIEEMQKLISLEGYLNEPLPTTLLTKLSLKKRLSEEEENSLERWIERINTLGDQISVTVFHTALHTFINHLKTSNEGSSANLVDLEMSLVDRNLQIFFQIDSMHYEETRLLKAKDPIVCKGRHWILGEQVGKKNEECDHTLLFSLEGATDRLAIFGINKAILGLKKRIGKDDHWGIPFVKIFDVDEEGTCAFVEILHDSLEGKSWNSTPHALSKKEQRTLTPVVNMIKWWIKKNFTPKEFSLKYLMFNKEDRLTYTKPLFREDFNYSLLEDLVFQIANGNLPIFQFLMDASGLHTHATRVYYQKMAEKAAKGKKANAKKQASFHYLDDPKVIDRGKALHEQIIAIKKRAVKEIETTYVIPDRKALYAMVNETALACYQETKAASVLWPGMEKLIVQAVIKKETFELLPLKRHT